MINRRQCLQSFLGGVGVAGVTTSLFSSQNDSARDRFGGWKGKRFEATGFFRVEKDERWWLVTPEGNAFLSFGINHFEGGMFRHLFNAKAWSKQFGVSLADSEAFRAASRKWLVETCREYGFTTLGVHTDLRTANDPEPKVPYIGKAKFIQIPHWSGEIPDENFVDVFSDEFEAHCDARAREFAAPCRDDPYLLGYAMNDCPLFTEEDLRERTDVLGGARRESRVGWPRRLRNLGAEAPGKIAYVETMREVYRDQIADFNETYSTSFRSFGDLASAVGWRGSTDLSNANETRDNLLFLQHAVDRYYRVAKDSILRHDPNHLFFGDKLNANTDSLDTVLSVTSRYTDLVFYQMYARYETQRPGLDRWSKRVNQPFLNGDSAFTMITDQMPRPFGPVADDLEQRIEWTVEFFEKAFARPDFVGWHYCGLLDADQRIPRKRGRQHSGLMDPFGSPYPGLREAIRDASDRIYSIATTG